jgi:hypothetical protein
MKDVPIAPDKKLFTTGGKPGPGRPKGSKDKIAPAVKRDIAEFFKNLTIESLRWRENVKRQMETANDPAEFRFWTRIALEYGFGTPMKMQPDPQGAFARRMAFITPLGLPWEQDPLVKEESKLLALQAANEEREIELDKKREAQAGLVAKQAAQEDEETLELVRPEDFTLGGR